MRALLHLLPLVFLLASCAAGQKKIIVLSQGSATIDTDNRRISVTGDGHEEKTMLLHDEGKVDFELNTSHGNAVVNLEGTGVYIINTKKDTIVGSLVNYTAPKTKGERISEAEMMANIDSLEQIIGGKVSAEKKTFFILPLQAIRVTGNMDAHIVTPFHQMTSISVKAGETPEVYRFYPIAEVRNTLAKLKRMVGTDGQPIND